MIHYMIHAMLHAIVFRYMRLADLDSVTEIESRSFADAWPRRVFEGDLTGNIDSHLFVVERPAIPTAMHDNQSLIVAYGGFWHFEEECHIGTLASHPDQRGQGYGELALLGMLRRAMALGSDSATLEVRASNTTAQALYTKYGFSITGRRRRYYVNNGEDAYIMSVSAFDEAFRTLHAANTVTLQDRLPFQFDDSGYLADHRKV